MKKVNYKSLLILGVTAVMTTACGHDGPTPTSSVLSSTVDENVITTDQDYNNYGLAGKKYRDEYNVLSVTAIGDLNYLTTQESANAQHFANFIDGLLVHNEFGVLEKNLATSVKHDEDYKKFEFTVRDGVKWQRYDGSQYKNAAGEPQFVKAEDWVASAKLISTYTNASDLQYLIGSFVKGTTEYYYYTRIKAEIADGTIKNIKLTEHAKVAEKLNKYIKENAPAVWKLEYGDGDLPIEAEDIPHIANLERFGVKAEGNKVTYELNQEAPYFPTLFTYSAYMPVNEEFVKTVKFSKFGKTQDAFLFNGPYLLKKWSTTQTQYVENPDYWNKANVITVPSINYKILQDTSLLTDDYTRTEFEAGRIDGFSLNKKDGIGWKKYVTGENNEGDYQNPVSPYVNSRLLDTIGNMYGSNLVLDRDTTKKTTSYATGSTVDTVNNTARALRLNDVRKAILDAVDYDLLYDLRYESTEEALRAQEKVYTYVPKGFVIDDNGDDYLTHYYKVYGEKKGMPAGDIDDPKEGTAAYALRPGQLETAQQTPEQVQADVAKAKKAIELWNARGGAQITYPIRVEYYSSYFDADTKTMDDQIIASLNERLNGVKGSYPYFQVVPTDKLTSANYQDVSRSGEWDLAYIQWGWGADYGDPLSFMNTYIKNGDWKDIFGYVAEEKVSNYRMNAGQTALEETDLLAHYTDVVAEGAAQTSDFNARYDLFAEAEYELINELNIYRPQINNGQGWALSVSKAAGYYMPTASYGLSSDRFTGMFVLEDVMTREERQTARERQTAKKEAYVREHGSINIYDENNELIG